MIVWIVCTLMVAIAAVGVTIPLVRRYDARRARAPESAALSRQLADLEAQSAAEDLPADVAEGLKTETVRRFLDEGPAPDGATRPFGPRVLIALGLGLAVIVAVGGTLLYVTLGRPDLAGGAAPAAQAAADSGAPAGHVGDMIAELEAKLRQTPNDPEGWRMLGWSYMRTGRYDDSARAYGRAADLEPTSADDKSAQGEALVKAADGHVTPQAQAAFEVAVRLDATDPRARYFLAAAKDQAGDHAGAMNDWIALLKSAPPGAPWYGEVRDFVVQIAKARGEDVAGRLPPPQPAPPAEAASGAGGPSPDQVAAAQQAPAADQQAMIRGMVDGLAAKLKANPRNAEGWMRLMRARMVLGERDVAAGAYRDAMKAFANSPSDQAALTQSARQSGVPGA
jgi:cytochrome c-type biogenesis protein CcmH